jgi:ABC-type transporter Mla MlaB component
LNAPGKQLIEKVASVTASDFAHLALEIFQYQATHNVLYAEYLKLLRVNPALITDLTDIPFLPIQLFKSYAVKTGDWQPEVIFASSGTTAPTRSHHHLPDLAFYLHNARRGFERFYGNVKDYCILALLPSYLERTDSSLVAMVAHFIQLSRYPQSGFFLHHPGELLKTLEQCKRNNIPTILFGVSFALYDLAEQYELDLSSFIIMETGGFKSRKEILREELHHFLCQRFNVPGIHSEYGMTELLSQAYSPGKGVFQAAPTLRVFTRQVTDPLQPERTGKTGLLSVIDLANIFTISFILTEDLGSMADDGAFRVLGRADQADIRGCTLLLPE